jgi:ribosome recycling factor
MNASEILRESEVRFKKSIDSAAHDFATLRTGRANPALLDNLKVDYYGQLMPISQVGTVTVPDARLLLITPWDKGTLAAIEKAITKSDLGLSPANDGTAIRLSIPPLTQERRKEFVKQLANKGEAGRVSLRNIRRDTIEQLKRDEEVPEDDVKRAEKDIQKLLDRAVVELDSLLKAKEAELLEG